MPQRGKAFNRSTFTLSSICVDAYHDWGWQLAQSSTVLAR